jgi:hypothetical protein
MTPTERARALEQALRLHTNGVWRFKAQAPGPWRYGWASHVSAGLVRMGYWNGDAHRGPIVSRDEVEWQETP